MCSKCVNMCIFCQKMWSAVLCEFSSVLVTDCWANKILNIGNLHWKDACWHVVFFVMFYFWITETWVLYFYEFICMIFQVISCTAFCWFAIVMNANELVCTLQFLIWCNVTGQLYIFYHTLCPEKRCHFIFDYNSRVSCSIFIIFSPLETRMNTPPFRVIYLLNSLKTP